MRLSYYYCIKNVKIDLCVTRSELRLVDCVCCKNQKVIYLIKTFLVVAVVGLEKKPRDSHRFVEFTHKDLSTWIV